MLMFWGMEWELMNGFLGFALGCVALRPEDFGVVLPRTTYSLISRSKISYIRLNSLNFRKSQDTLLEKGRRGMASSFEPASLT